MGGLGVQADVAGTLLTIKRMALLIKFTKQRSAPLQTDAVPDPGPLRPAGWTEGLADLQSSPQTKYHVSIDEQIKEPLASFGLFRSEIDRAT